MYEDVSDELMEAAMRVESHGGRENMVRVVLKTCATMLEGEPTSVDVMMVKKALSGLIETVDDGVTLLEWDRDEHRSMFSHRPDYLLAYSLADEAIRDALRQLEGSNEDEAGEAAGAREDAAHAGRGIRATRQG